MFERRMLAAIHQPNFFPWLGYFDKIRRADIFILLDQVAYPRAGSGGMGSWANRSLLNIGGEPRWVGAPVRRVPLGTPIRDVAIDDTQPWRTKLVRTLATYYNRAAHYSRAMRLIESLILARETNLAAFNAAVIRAIAVHLEIETRFVRQSDLTAEGHGTELLINLVKAVGCDAYLAGGGAGGYQEDHLFPAHSVELVYQNFAPRPYGPADRFVPGLSVIDYLMHDGRPLAEAFQEKPP
jgi:hypothetical protein